MRRSAIALRFRKCTSLVENFFHFSLQKPYKVVLFLGEVVLNPGEVVLASGGLGFVDTCERTTDHSIPAFSIYSADSGVRGKELDRHCDTKNIKLNEVNSEQRTEI